MANQPENSQFDAGVYQIEPPDPVQGGVGGVTNRPILALTNRTRWLKDRIDNLFNGLALPEWIAPKNSPVLTGSPAAPTPPAGDNDTSISTTEFIQRAKNGRTVKNVAGGVNVVLTAGEVDAGIIALTGVLTANIDVIVPAASGVWVIENATGGNFTLRVKTPAGAGTFVAQGKSLAVICNGTDVRRAVLDFTDAELLGVPTAPTAAAGTATTQVASCEFVTNAVLNAISAGAIGYFAASTAPAGWLKANGAAVSRVAYNVLFARIGTTYGNGDGATTFNLPDLRGVFPRGLDDGRGVDAGRSLGSMQSSQNLAHNHTASADTQGWHGHTGVANAVGDHQHWSGWGEANSRPNPFGSDYSNNKVGSSSTDYDNAWWMTSPGGAHNHSLSIDGNGSHSHNITVDSSGGTEARPVNVALLACIKF